MNSIFVLCALSLCKYPSIKQLRSYPQYYSFLVVVSSGLLSLSLYASNGTYEVLGDYGKSASEFKEKASPVLSLSSLLSI